MPRIFNGERTVFSTVLGWLYIYIQRNEEGLLPQTVHKNLTKIGHRPKS